ncbi:MAG: hypothetical protein JWM10_4021 [Myxococcaceae bacterium]|nr:hypothetical protein [Myxococcaceae bacterium]
MRGISIGAIVLVGCSSTTPPVATDAGGTTPDSGDAAAPKDVAVACTEAVRVHSVLPERVIVALGAESQVLLRLAGDRAGCDGVFRVESLDATVLAAPTTMPRVTVGHGSVAFAVRGVAAGRTRLRITQIDPTDMAGAASTTVEVEVRAPALPECPMGASAALGVLRAGQTAATPAGSPIGVARVAVPAATTGLPTEAVSVACAEAPVPEGYDALGPAVTFGPGAVKFTREVGMSIPANGARVTSLYEAHIEVAWTPPGPMARTRIVPLADTRLDDEGRAVSFSGYRLGTYRAVQRRGIGTNRVQRSLRYRALYGISMGAVGTSMIGTRHPELFDVLAPLGGPADSGFSGGYLRRWVFGGFCTEAERATLGDAACATTSATRTPPPDDLGMVGQHFEHFYAPPGRGTGGTFDREARFQGFRDIARMFGNPVMGTDPAGGTLPFGVPAGEIRRTDAERCAHPVVLGGSAAGADERFYDDEYNPEGRYPVITFCDGGRSAVDVGAWDGSVGNYPVEITLAVDRNANGRRDPGEPVIRNFGEPYRDVGSDGLASRDEPGYDVVTNPDPSGDDYDRQYNPAGAEGNQLPDAMEPFDDLGLDGVACPAGRRCPYDQGEGDGRFTQATSMLAGYDRLNPRVLYAGLAREEANRLATWIDGGVRDALQFGVNANHFAGAVAQQGVGLRILNGFTGLQPGRTSTAESERMFDPGVVDWARVPAHTMVRYGSVDATAAEIADGDGAHVGTNGQIATRLLSSLFAVQARWPDGDRALAPFSTTVDNTGRCANGYQCAFEFRSERTMRTGPVSVFLPPGYHDPANAGVRYPVVYLLHGYGMQPSEFAGAALVAASRMVARNTADWQRPAKFILVFPDGRCREGDGCLEGTFYVDSIAGNARMETYFLDLYSWVDRTYRTRPTATVEVVE